MKAVTIVIGWLMLVCITLVGCDSNNDIPFREFQVEYYSGRCDTVLATSIYLKEDYKQYYYIFYDDNLHSGLHRIGYVSERDSVRSVFLLNCSGAGK